jgi:cytochrome c biogenesis protein CcmG, thiol:disulfide interchange protein DsbE
MARQRIEVLMRTSIVVLAAVLVWVIADAVREPHITVAGEAAPEFAVTTDRGARLTPKGFGGRVLVLNFWASWCAPCIQETPSLNAFQSSLRQSGVVVLGVSIDKDERAYRTFLQHFQITFETARDPDQKISSKYGTFKIPESYIIDRNGRVAAKIISDRDWMEPEVIRFVKSLL